MRITILAENKLKGIEILGRVPLSIEGIDAETFNSTEVCRNWRICLVFDVVVSENNISLVPGSACEVVFLE